MKLTNKILEAVNRGIKFALDDFEDQEDIQGLTNSKVSHEHGTKEWLNLNIVDLGLPSGTMWCKYNLGCDIELLEYNPEKTKPEDWYGSYYAWGDPVCDRNSWGEAAYKFTGKMIKYNNYDKLINLLPEDDQAIQVNKNFKTPTADLSQELLECTKMRWVDNYNNIKGLSGCLFINRKDSENYIFIPASSYISWRGKDEDDIKVALSTATRYEKDPYRCYVLIVRPDEKYGTDSYLTNTMYRTIGIPIRPVINL